MTSNRTSLVPKNVKNPLFSTGIPNFPDEEFTQGVLLVPPPEQLLSQGGEVDRFLGQDVPDQAVDPLQNLDSDRKLPPPPPSTLLPAYRTQSVRAPVARPPDILPPSVRNLPDSEPDFKQIPLDGSVPLYNPSAVLWSTQREGPHDLNRTAPPGDTGVPLYDPSHVGSVLPPHATKRPLVTRPEGPHGPTPAALDPAYSSLSKHISTCSPTLVIDSGSNLPQSVGVSTSRKSSGSSSVHELHGFNSQPPPPLSNSVSSPSLHSLPQKTSHLLSQAYQSASNFSFFPPSFGSSDPTVTEPQTLGEKVADSAVWTAADSSASFLTEQVPLYPVEACKDPPGLPSTNSLITPSPVRYFPPPTGPLASSKPTSNFYPSAPPEPDTPYHILVANPQSPNPPAVSQVSSVSNSGNAGDNHGKVSTSDSSSDYSISSFFNNLNPFKRGASPSVKAEVSLNSITPGSNFNSPPLPGSQSLEPFTLNYNSVPSVATSSSSPSLSVAPPSNIPDSSPNSLPPPPLTGFQTSNTPLSSLPKIHHSFPSNPYSIHSQKKVQAPAFRPEHYFTPIPIAEISKSDNSQEPVRSNSEQLTSSFLNKENFSPGSLSQTQESPLVSQTVPEESLSTSANVKKHTEFEPPAVEPTLISEGLGLHPTNTVPLYSANSVVDIKDTSLPPPLDSSQAAPSIKSNSSPLVSLVTIGPPSNTPNNQQPQHVINSGQPIVPPPVQNPLVSIPTASSTNSFRISSLKRPVYAPVPDLGISSTNRLAVMSNDQNILNNANRDSTSPQTLQNQTLCQTDSLIPSSSSSQTILPVQSPSTSQSVSSVHPPPLSQAIHLDHSPSSQSTPSGQPISSVQPPLHSVSSIQSPPLPPISSVHSPPSQAITSVQPPPSSQPFSSVNPPPLFNPVSSHQPPLSSLPFSSINLPPPSQPFSSVNPPPLFNPASSNQSPPPSQPFSSVNPPPLFNPVSSHQPPLSSQPFSSINPPPPSQPFSSVNPPPIFNPVSSNQSPPPSQPFSSVNPHSLFNPVSCNQTPSPSLPISSIQTSPFQPISSVYPLLPPQPVASVQQRSSSEPVSLIQGPPAYPISSTQLPPIPQSVSCIQSPQLDLSFQSASHQPVSFAQPPSIKPTGESSFDQALPSIPLGSSFNYSSQSFENQPLATSYSCDPSAAVNAGTITRDSQAIDSLNSGIESGSMDSERTESIQDGRSASTELLGSSPKGLVSPLLSDLQLSEAPSNKLVNETLSDASMQHYERSVEQQTASTSQHFDNVPSSDVLVAPPSPLASYTPPLNQPFISMAVSQTYRPVYHHWFYRRGDEKKNQWNPFSMADSLNLEQRFASDSKTEGSKVVATDGGRYDVDVGARKRHAVYWHEQEGDVRRCSWFVKGPLDSKYQPYDENIAALLEEEYKTACTRNEWNRRVELADGEVIIIHSPNAISHHQRSSSPDPWGNPPPMAEKPRVVKRGLDEFDIPEGEPTQVDHLLLLVHGIGKVCDLRFRSLVEVVDDFRSISVSLVGSHFKSAMERGKVGRVEVLPVEWHRALHTDAIDQRLADITLPSIPKARQFTNETLLDILFYTSPVFCERIVEAVGVELNRVYSLYLERNPGYKGGVSLGGHSLGSLILFDMLCHQKPPHPKLSSTPSFSIDEGDEDLSSLGCLKTRAKLSRRMSYLTIGTAGTGQPYIAYPQLKFQPRAFFALGSPIGMFVTVRGIESLGEEFKFPTCPSFFNIFHPNDPVAYRMEGLINSDMAHHPAVLIPHHKGRKRMHLELKETMAHLTAAVKQKLLDSVKNTWNTVSSFTRFTRLDHTTIENQVDKVLEDEILCKERSDDSASSVGDSADAEGMDVKVGVLNGGRRIDYVLQEAPLETFNQYISAVRSHLVYWESEDTMLLILKEIYGTKGITADCQVPQPILPFDLSAEANADPGTAYSHYTVSPSPAPSRQHTIAEEL